MDRVPDFESVGCRLDPYQAHQSSLLRNFVWLTPLQKALKTLNTYPEIYVEISGHTDNVGNAKSNQKLSQLRANAVRDWLIAQGIDGNRLTAVGYGASKPMVANDSPENKAKNRRIEFSRTK